MTSIPACSECEHYRDDDFFAYCKFHYFETPDYINGKHNRHDMFCVHARESERYCGHEGKNFKQQQIVVEEKKESSLTKGVKSFVKMFLCS